MSDRHKPRRGLLCVRCRARKVRCDNQSPCGVCAKEGTECIRTSQDRRKERYSQAFVDGLQAKATKLEAVVAAVRQALADSDNPRDQRKPDSGVYGPTLVFNTEPTAPYDEGEHLVIRQLNQDPVIVECLQQFFKWQYPGHFAYIIRLGFLHEFLNPQPHFIYCSSELVYALAAMGALIADDPNIKLRAIDFYTKARTRLLSGGPTGKFDRPLVALMHALLVLLFFDLSHGHNSLLWMLSGLGVRMGFDLGFHLHPESVFTAPSNPASPEYIAIRLRVFWGAYMADHFVSLVFGRPTQLKKSDAWTAEPEDVRELLGVSPEYLFISNSADGEAPYLGIPIALMVTLIDICNALIDDIFNLGAARHKLAARYANKLEVVRQFNHQMIQWRCLLPLELQWTPRNVAVGADNPTKLLIRLYYYMALLCLNRPFLDVGVDGNDISSPRAVVLQAVDEVLGCVTRFRDVHGLQKALIYVVYALVFLVSVLLILRPPLTPWERQPQIDLIMGYIHELSSTWNLAGKCYDQLIRKMNSQVSAPSLVPEVTSQGLPQYYVDDPAGLAAMSQPPQSIPGLVGPPMFLGLDFMVNDWEPIFLPYHDTMGARPQ